ncbi:MAG: SRPBCC family protein [Sphingomonas sp.]
MTIAPIIKSVSVAVPPERAFALFAGDIGRWWSPNMHIAPEPFTEIMIEPRAGGRWFERDAAGAECQWGKVLAWEPPGRLLLAWQLDASFTFDPDLITEVEVTFEPEATGSRVTLTHRNLECFGPSTEKMVGRLAGGWPGLVERFATFIQEKAA